MKSNINHNHYEAAKMRAICDIRKNLNKYLRYMKKFENTGKTLFTFKAMYHMDAANRLARDWGMQIVDYSKNHINFRDLG